VARPKLVVQYFHTHNFSLNYAQNPLLLNQYSKGAKNVLFRAFPYTSENRKGTYYIVMKAPNDIKTASYVILEAGMLLLNYISGLTFLRMLKYHQWCVG